MENSTDRTTDGSDGGRDDGGRDDSGRDDSGSRTAAQPEETTDTATDTPAPAPTSTSTSTSTSDKPAPDKPTSDPTPDKKSPHKQTPRSRTLRRARRTLLALALVLLLPLLAAETALRVNYTGDPAEGTRTRGQDAIWLGHAWVDGRKKDADIEALAARLRGTGIRDLYVHAGPLEHDGTLPASAYRGAGSLIPAVHRALPGVRVQAWLGDVLATESPDGLRLERAATRAAVVESTRAVLAAGFEGAHFDLEPLHSGDRDYLGLLDDLRALTHARGAVLSVAAHQIDPLPAFHSVWGTLTGHPKWWSQAYFGEVARRVDQIAVMSYDTMQPLQSLYGGYVAQQTSLALEATPPTTDLLMGLPFFHENRFGHWDHAETVPAAVRGVRLGLSRTDADRVRFGVALYVDFAATEADWTAYREGWARTAPPE
ncbi:membrane protein [Streptomyces sp. Tu 6176]|uniref:membrane protein n=1 Tax=Streptomyces sp. Tu 6176 TaxID=1470557 RepID=UPI0004491AB1|nr:membrane protein [Streptomyces sp. Tu 6176]EYT84192.1 membrane protein [Streptomyces sp. Tu 6176]